MKINILLLILLVSSNMYSQEILDFSNDHFQFCLTKKCENNDCEITKIDIIKDGAFLQTIEPEENQSSKSFPKEQLFLIEDMNFDGIKDFRLMEFLPAAPNVPYLFFIYNPETGLFENNSEYREITSPIFDHEKQQINSTWRNGCCEHARDIYVLKNGIPKLTERFVIGHNSQNKEYSEYWKVEDGKLQLVKEKVE